MATYDSYKDSGVKWLGQIPSHWELKKLRAFFDRRNHKVSDTDFEPLSVTKNGIVPQMENVAKSKDNDNRRLVKVGDFVINSRSDRKGSSGVSTLEGSVSFVNTIMMPRDGIIPTFCNYLLKSYGFVEENYRNGHGIVADLWTTSFDEQKHIRLAIPPLAEQEVMVAYLDKVTGEIDRAIEAQRKMIDALNERKQIIITRAVTHGLNPDASLRDSGIDWLGQIPEHWKCTKLKYFIKIKSGDAIVNSDLTDNGKYPVYGGGEMMGRSNNYNIDAGNIVIGRVGARCGCVTPIKEKSWATDNALVITPIGIKTEYLIYVLYGADLNKIASTNAQPLLTGTKVKNTFISVPPLREQVMIANFLNSKCEEINEVIANCERMIALLTERKQIIINEVVTGKKKVICKNYAYKKYRTPTASHKPIHQT